MQPGKPVILVFIDWFTPGYKAGGPIASCVNFVQLMKNDYAVYIFTSDTDLGETRPYPGIEPDKWLPSAEGEYFVYYARRKDIRKKQIRDVIRDLAPEFIYLNHLFSPWFVVYPLWLKHTGFIAGKVIVCPRGALYASALAIKTYKKRPFIWLFRWLRIHKEVVFHATSEKEALTIKSFFPGAVVREADDLPRLRQFPLTTVEKKPGILNAVYIARIHPIKNLFFFLGLLQNIKGTINFSIVGPVEDERYWESCQKLMRGLPDNIRVEYLGAQPNEKMEEILVCHHLAILPTQGENFGHSIFESFLAGRPVLISDQTPWVNLSTKEAGWDISLSKPEAFIEALETSVEWDQAGFNTYSKGAWLLGSQFISSGKFNQQYLRLFN